MSDDSKNTPNEQSRREPQANQEQQPEYRLVQIENAQYTEADDEIDLVQLIKSVWVGRKTVMYSLIAFIALGLFIALGTAEEYSSEVKLMPEVEEQGTGGRLGGIAAQFGMGDIGGRTTQGISPDLFPDVATSLPFMQSLMDHQIEVDRLDSTVTMYSYLSDHNSPDAVSVAERYTIKLPFTILGWVRGIFEDDEDEQQSEQQITLIEEPSPVERLIRMNRNQWEVVETLRNRINTQFNQENGTVTVNVEMRDPEVAAEVAERVSEYIREYINTYNTEKAREDLEFIEERYDEAEERFLEAQRELAKFTDRHRGTMSAVDEIERQRLQSEYDMAFNVYNSMAERLEEAKIQVQEDTRVVKTLEPAAVPYQRSSPRRGLIMVVSVMLGGMVGLGIVFGRHMYESIKERWDE